MSVTIEAKAAKKAVLHACKHPTSDVIGSPASPGILVGTVHEHTYNVTNAYPVCHSRITGVSTQFCFEVVRRRSPDPSSHGGQRNRLGHLRKLHLRPRRV